MDPPQIHKFFKTRSQNPSKMGGSEATFSRSGASFWSQRLTHMQGLVMSHLSARASREPHEPPVIPDLEFIMPRA